MSFQVSDLVYNTLFPELGYGRIVDVDPRADEIRVEWAEGPASYTRFPASYTRSYAEQYFKKSPSPAKTDKDQGEQRHVDPDTGGEKGRKPEEYALIPVAPLADVARVYGFGAKKYDPRNWEKGYPWSWSYSSLQRHLNAFWEGEDFDPESGLPHLAHAVFHCFALMEWAETHPEKDDRAKWPEKR